MRPTLAAMALTLGFVGSLSADGIPLLGKKKPAEATTPASNDPWQKPMATVNGEPITKADLADELIATFGARQMDNLINRKLVEQACRAKNIVVTREEIEADLAQYLKGLRLSEKEFKERILANREMTLEQFKRDNVWPKVALKKLAETTVKVTDDDIQKAFEATFGEKREVRMLVVAELKRATDFFKQFEVIEDLQKRLEAFEEVCKKWSLDEATRPFGGACEPIARHSGFELIENQAFKLEPGEVSTIVQVPNGYLLLMCVRKIEARKDITLDMPFDPERMPKKTVRDVLYADVHEKKLRSEIEHVFVTLKNKSEVMNYLGEDFKRDNAAENMATQPKQGVNR